MKVTRKRAEVCSAGPMLVHVVLVIDSATGQNGLAQVEEFNDALGLDGIIMTKLDGTAKGGIALAVAEQLEFSIIRIGVGEQVEDLQRFDAGDFAAALVGQPAPSRLESGTRIDRGPLCNPCRFLIRAVANPGRTRV